MQTLCDHSEGYLRQYQKGTKYNFLTMVNEYISWLVFHKVVL